MLLAEVRMLLTTAGGPWLLGAAWVLGVVVAMAPAVAGLARLPRLAAMPPAAPGTEPRVSVVVAARNEAEGLQSALGSLLASRGVRLEVVAVDDRSSDATPDILERLARGDPRLRTVHLRRVPPGWLGKNHALQRGAEAAGGDWLLFTDADVRFAPDAISRAVAFARRRELAHVTALPGLITSGPAIRLFMVWMLLIFAVWQRPWQAGRTNHRASAGFGAFNLVRRDAYWGVGGHAAFPLALTDDVVLGARLKAAGYRQSLVVAAHVGAGRPLVELQWYPDLRAAVQGFEKNSFAMFRFQPWAVACCSLLGLLCAALPPAEILLAPGWARLPWVFGYLLTSASVCYAAGLIVDRRSWGPALLFPVAQLILVWTVVRSSVITLRRGGVRWRDTFYGLAELRAATVPPRHMRTAVGVETNDLLAPPP